MPERGAFRRTLETLRHLTEEHKKRVQLQTEHLHGSSKHREHQLRQRQRALHMDMSTDDNCATLHNGIRVSVEVDRCVSLSFPGVRRKTLLTTHYDNAVSFELLARHPIFPGPECPRDPDLYLIADPYEGPPPDLPGELAEIRTAAAAKRKQNVVEAASRARSSSSAPRNVSSNNARNTASKGRGKSDKNDSNQGQSADGSSSANAPPEFFVQKLAPLGDDERYQPHTEVNQYFLNERKERLPDWVWRPFKQSQYWLSCPYRGCNFYYTWYPKRLNPQESDSYKVYSTLVSRIHYLEELLQVQIAKNKFPPRIAKCLVAMQDQHLFLCFFMFQEQCFDDATLLSPVERFGPQAPGEATATSNLDTDLIHVKWQQLNEAVKRMQMSGRWCEQELPHQLSPTRVLDVLMPSYEFVFHHGELPDLMLLITLIGVHGPENSADLPVLRTTAFNDLWNMLIKGLGQPTKSRDMPKTSHAKVKRSTAVFELELLMCLALFGGYYHHCQVSSFKVRYSLTFHLCYRRPTQDEFSRFLLGHLTKDGTNTKSIPMTHDQLALTIVKEYLFAMIKLIPGLDRCYMSKHFAGHDRILNKTFEAVNLARSVLENCAFGCNAQYFAFQATFDTYIASVQQDKIRKNLDGVELFDGTTGDSVRSASAPRSQNAKKRDNIVLPDRLLNGLLDDNDDAQDQDSNTDVLPLKRTGKNGSHASSKSNQSEQPLPQYFALTRIDWPRVLKSEQPLRELRRGRNRHLPDNVDTDECARLNEQRLSALRDTMKGCIRGAVRFLIEQLYLVVDHHDPANTCPIEKHDMFVVDQDWIGRGGDLTLTVAQLFRNVRNKTMSGAVGQYVMTLAPECLSAFYRMSLSSKLAANSVVIGSYDPCCTPEQRMAFARVLFAHVRLQTVTPDNAFELDQLIYMYCGDFRDNTRYGLHSDHRNLLYELHGCSLVQDHPGGGQRCGCYQCHPLLNGRGTSDDQLYREYQNKLASGALCHLLLSAPVLDVIESILNRAYHANLPYMCRMPKTNFVNSVIGAMIRAKVEAVARAKSDAAAGPLRSTDMSHDTKSSADLHGDLDRNEVLVKAALSITEEDRLLISAYVSRMNVFADLDYTWMESVFELDKGAMNCLRIAKIMHETNTYTIDIASFWTDVITDFPRLFFLMEQFFWEVYIKRAVRVYHLPYTWVWQQLCSAHTLKNTSDFLEPFSKKLFETYYCPYHGEVTSFVARNNPSVCTSSGCTTQATVHASTGHVYCSAGIDRESAKADGNIHLLRMIASRIWELDQQGENPASSDERRAHSGSLVQDVFEQTQQKSAATEHENEHEHMPMDVCESNSNADLFVADEAADIALDAATGMFIQDNYTNEEATKLASKDAQDEMEVMQALTSGSAPNIKGAARTIASLNPNAKRIPSTRRNSATVADHGEDQTNASDEVSEVTSNANRVFEIREKAVKRNTRGDSEYSREKDRKTRKREERIMFEEERLRRQSERQDSNSVPSSSLRAPSNHQKYQHETKSIQDRACGEPMRTVDTFGKALVLYGTTILNCPLCLTRFVLTFRSYGVFGIPTCHCCTCKLERLLLTSIEPYVRARCYMCAPNARLHKLSRVSRFLVIDDTSDHCVFWCYIHLCQQHKRNNIGNATPNSSLTQLISYINHETTMVMIETDRFDDDRPEFITVEVLVPKQYRNAQVKSVARDPRDRLDKLLGFL